MLSFVFAITLYKILYSDADKREVTDVRVVEGLLLTKFSPPVNLLTYIISSLFKLTIILVPLMLSHWLVHLPPRPLRSQIALFSMPRLISGINFHFYFVNQFHLFMLTSIHPPLSPSITPSLFHSKLKTYLFGKSFPP